MASRSKTLNRPNFFILGAPKCGTTSLATWLSQHPEILMSSSKEPNFFDTDHRRPGRLTLDEYHRLFAADGREYRAIGEASPWYLASECAAANILDYNREARFILCVRNPVEMVYALHNQRIANGDEPLGVFEDAWSAQESRLSGNGIPDRVDPKLYQYGPACKLGGHLQRLKRLVPEDRIHVVVLDDMGRDARHEYDRVLEFLGLPSHPADLRPVNRSFRRRFPRIHSAVKEVGTLKRRLGLQRSFGILGRIKSWNKRAYRRPEPRPETLAMLRAYFIEDVDLLSRQIGRDLGGWMKAQD